MFVPSTLPPWKPWSGCWLCLPPWWPMRIGMGGCLFPTGKEFRKASSGLCRVFSKVHVALSMIIILSDYLVLQCLHFFHVLLCQGRHVLFIFVLCTDQVIGSDDVAASDNIGVLNGTPGWKKGSTSGSLCSRQSLAWCSPTSSMYNRRSPGLRHSRCMGVLGDQVVRDRRKGHIAERSGRLA